MTSTTQHSLKSLEQQSQKERDSVTVCGLQNKELHSLSSTSSENISACLQERYCNGIAGVPITFFTNYNPDEFFIVGMAHGDLGVELGLKPYPRELKKLNKGLRDGDLYFIDENGKPILPYRRILIQKKL